MSRLLQIADDVRRRLDSRMRARPLESFASALQPGRAGRFRDALRRGPGDPLRFIAEVKKASPSRGALNTGVDVVEQAQAYARGGAAAVSVLTEPDHFKGAPGDLRRVSAAVAVPVIQKDFTLEDYQLYEAVELGAAAVLLIAALLPSHRLRALREGAAVLGLDALVEVHDERELEEALASGAEVVGINNRNLATFDVDLETTFTLLPRIPADRVRVSESGILERAHVERLEAAGADAALVGEALMSSADPERRLRELRGAGAA